MPESVSEIKLKHINMIKRTCFLILFLWLTAAAFPVFAQDYADTLESCPRSCNTAAFDLPWLAKYYGRDWKTDSLSAVQSAADSMAKAEAERLSYGKAASSDNCVLSLRANLLRWAALTPDLGIELRISPSVGVMVNGSWTSWTWNDNARRYALWEVAPEVRWYLGEKKTWHVGAMFKTGQFNYKFSGTGRQGDLLGGGITGGYQLRLNKALALDFTLGLGYLNADTERYDVIDGVRVRAGNETKHWIGPVNAGVTLVWKLL